MIDVLVFLFENYFDISTHPESDALARKLSAAGFDPDEVSFALDWLNDLKLARPVQFAADPRAFRIYTDEEQVRFADGCIDFVVFLETAGVINPPQRELILERALVLADEVVSLEKLKIVVLMVLWSQEQTLEPLIIEELLNVDNDALLH